MTAAETSVAPASPRRWFVFPLGVWMVTRLCFLWAGYLSLGLSPTQMRSNGGAFGLRPYPALDALCRWDCGWFDRLARTGYREWVNTNFWPGFPLMLRTLAQFTSIPIEFGVLILPNIFCLGAYLLVYRLFVRLENENSARWALVMWAAFPFSFFHASGYPETIMIFFSALAVWLALGGRHVPAGFVLGLGVLSRHLTIAMGLMLPVAQLKQRGWRGFIRSPPAWLGVAMPFVVASSFLIYSWRAWGDPLAFWKARNTWGATAWWSAREVMANFHRAPQVVLYLPFALIPTVGAVALARRRITWELAGAAVPLMAILWFIGGFGLGRYAASCWPAFLPWGRWLQKYPGLRFPLLVFLTMFQGWYFFLHTHHYEVQ